MDVNIHIKTSHDCHSLAAFSTCGICPSLPRISGAGLGPKALKCAAVLHAIAIVCCRSRCCGFARGWR